MCTDWAHFVAVARAQYDNTVRNSTGGIVQLVYGDDGLDPVSMEGKDGTPIDFRRLLMRVRSDKRAQHFPCADGAQHFPCADAAWPRRYLPSCRALRRDASWTLPTHLQLFRLPSRAMLTYAMRRSLCASHAMITDIALSCALVVGRGRRRHWHH